jgi:hypothetical protein
MPNSRIEAAFTLTDDIIETLGAWTTDGNALGVGGDNLLGSTDNFEFFFITNGIRRAGFLANGYRFLQTPGTSTGGHARYRELTFETQTTDATETVVFSHAIADNTNYRYQAHTQFLSQDNSEYGGFQRSIIARRLTSTTLGKEHAHFTDVTDLNTRSFWRVQTNVMQFVVQGLAATTINWSGMITFQGVLNTP